MDRDKDRKTTVNGLRQGVPIYAKKKVALVLQNLKKYELPELPPPKHDPELFTPEQLQALKKNRVQK
ncbi:CRM-domain containing factor CFM9, mitochondrial-like protein [Drosera capensis]